MMVTTQRIRALLSEGHRDDLLSELVALNASERRSVCKSAVVQANAVLSACSGATTTSWLRDLRPDYPGGHEQFVGAWKGRLRTEHWDAATAVLLASKKPAIAAKVWPVPEDKSFARRIFPALFPDDISVFVDQWSSDFVRSPKHWDRNRGRAVMYEWIEEGLAGTPQGDGAVLMIFSGWTAAPGKPLLRWLLDRPRVTSELFTRIFTVQGVKGASLAQSDENVGDHPIRNIVVPGLIKAGIWERDFVIQGANLALSSDLPPYQKHWFNKLLQGLG